MTCVLWFMMAFAMGILRTWRTNSCDSHQKVLVRRGYSKMSCLKERKSLDEDVLGLDGWPVLVQTLEPL